MNTSLITPPETLPVSLSEAKNMLKLDDDLTEDDALISGLIRAGVEYAETFQNRRFITQAWNLYLPWFPSCDIIELPYAPLKSVSFIQYIHWNNDTVTLPASDYEVSLTGVVGKVQSVFGKSFPVARDTFEAVTIRFICGYGDDPADVPEITRLAILLYVKLMYDHRGEAMDLSPVDCMLTGNRVMGFA